MSENFVSLAILLTPTEAEASLLLECEKLCKEYRNCHEDELDELYATMSAGFKSAFPKKEGEDNPFSNFLALFSDPDYPTCSVEYFKRTDDGAFYIAGTAADPAAIAGLIRVCAPSVLPFGFEWAATCSKLRAGEFGGGYYVITADGIEGGDTYSLMNAALDKLNVKPV